MAKGFGGFHMSPEGISSGIEGILLWIIGVILIAAFITIGIPILLTYLVNIGTISLPLLSTFFASNGPMFLLLAAIIILLFLGIFFGLLKGKRKM